jgi:hypothetical protein
MVYGWRLDGFQEGTSAVKPDCAGVRGVFRGIVKGISGMADAARSNDDVCCSNIGPLHVTGQRRGRPTPFK